MERISQTCSKKTERKIIEKNRRNHMKNLYSQLNSLLPPHTHFSKEALSLPDQIDETVNHIKNVETELQKLREKKQSLLGRKRWTDSNMTTLNSPKIEVRENGSNLEVVLISGLHVRDDSHFIFCEILRMLHEEGVDVFYSSFSVVGDSVFHTFHGQIGMGSENTIKFPPRHTYAELQSFANNFIGQTLYAKLYHATLPASAEDATIKILLKSTNHDDAVKLIDEILLLQHRKMISHPGLPKLIGYCHDGHDIGFVYSLKSLDTLQNLIPQDGFSWLQRMKVAIGFASLLAHLHGQLPPIMVRSLDPAQIIVDQDYSPKLMEFSLISGGIFPDRTKIDRAFNLCYGYIEPDINYHEYWHVKYDVFAFGVIVICLLSKRAFEKRHNEQLINEWAEAEYRPNKYMFGLGHSKSSLVHQTLKDSPGYFHSDGYKITKLAMDCVNEQRCFRPTMEEVVKSLSKLRIAREHGSFLGIQNLPSGFVRPSIKKGLFKKLHEYLESSL